MKRVLFISLLAGAVAATSAQPKAAGMPESAECEVLRALYLAPYYYCDCKEKSDTFAFPLEAEIRDTVWFTANVDDLQQGISAYWFADCSVTMEVYAFCTSTTPTFSVTIGKNQMYDIDIEKISKKLDEMGQTITELLGVLTPHIRVYPNGGTGKVYCYPYNHGPESTCGDPLPLMPGMPYICEKEENAYRLAPDRIDEAGKAFVHWKQDRNEECGIWLTTDSCRGKEIGRAVLSDSLHVYQPEPAELLAAREEGRDIWLHVSHAQGVTGRIYWYNHPQWTDPAKEVEQTTCSGKTIKVNLRPYTADTVFTDTIWVDRDMLRTQNVRLTFTLPETEFDTVYASPAELEQGFVYAPSGDKLYSYNDTVVEIRKPETCTRLVQVTVVETQGIEPQTANTAKWYKVMQNGQLLIIRDEKKYNVLGQPVD